VTDKTVTREDLALIVRKLEPVKRAGWGEVLIKVADGNIVFVEQTIGEQVKMELKTDN